MSNLLHQTGTGLMLWELAQQLRSLAPDVLCKRAELGDFSFKDQANGLPLSEIRLPFVDKWGETYSGQCLQGSDVAHGRGTLVSKSGALYEGYFKHDKYHGKGRRILTDGATYIGDWQAGKRHGMGTRTWPNGESYTGSFCDDKREGKGVFNFADGRMFDGEFKADQPHGKV